MRRHYWGLLFCLISTAAFADSRWHQHLKFQGPKGPAKRLFAEDDSAKVALYEGAGAWDSGVEHMKMFLSEHQYSYEVLKAADVIGGKLQSGKFEMLMMPGGESWEYLRELGPEGGKNILKFVSRGGGYFGVCAGAFYATSHRDGGFYTGNYGIGLLEGVAFDGTAYQQEPFIEGMMSFHMLPDVITQPIPSQLKIVMFGGPSFRFLPAESRKKDLRTLSTFEHWNEPAMIFFRYGRGQVFLSGPHLEIEESRTNWGEAFKDPDSEWPLMRRVVDALIVH